MEREVPVVSLLGDDGRYFWYHHTSADTVSAVNPLQLDNCLVSWAAATYILADFDYSTKQESSTTATVVPSTTTTGESTTTVTTTTPASSSGHYHGSLKVSIFMGIFLVSVLYFFDE
jgi:hypothetical protein